MHRKTTEPKIRRKPRGPFLVVSSVKFLHKTTRGRFLVVPSVVGLARESFTKY